MEFTVKVIIPAVAAVDDDDDGASTHDGLFHGVPGLRAISTDANAGLTEVTLGVHAGSLTEAARAALRNVQPVVALAGGIEPDAIAVMSEREHLRQLGGPAELAKMEAWLAQGNDDRSVER